MKKSAEAARLLIFLFLLIPSRRNDVLAATKKDKKMEAGHIKFILMDGIGKSFIDKTVTDQELLQAIREILI